MAWPKPTSACGSTRKWRATLDADPYDEDMRERTLDAGDQAAPSERSISGAETQWSRRLQALLLGGEDMLDVTEAARYLIRDDTNIDARVRRTLEAGMFVSYARSFVETRGGLPKLNRASNLSADLLDSHKQIIRRRNAVYAHTDETDMRQIQLSGPALDLWLSGQGELRHQWESPTAGMLQDVIDLAGIHLKKFHDAIVKIQKRTRLTL